MATQLHSTPRTLGRSYIARWAQNCPAASLGTHAAHCTQKTAQIHCTLEIAHRGSCTRASWAQNCLTFLHGEVWKQIVQTGLWMMMKKKKKKKKKMCLRQQFDFLPSAASLPWRLHWLGSIDQITVPSHIHCCHTIHCHPPDYSLPKDQITIPSIPYSTEHTACSAMMRIVHCIYIQICTCSAHLYAL